MAPRRKLDRSRKLRPAAVQVVKRQSVDEKKEDSLSSSTSSDDEKESVVPIRNSSISQRPRRQSASPAAKKQQPATATAVQRGRPASQTSKTSKKAPQQAKKKAKPAANKKTQREETADDDSFDSANDEISNPSDSDHSSDEDFRLLDVEAEEDDEEEDDDGNNSSKDSDNDEDDEPARRRATGLTKPSSTACRKSPLTSTAKRATAPKSSKPTTCDLVDSVESSDNDDEQQHRNSRRSAETAKRRLNNLSRSDTEDDQGDGDDNRVARKVDSKTRRRSIKEDSDDEEFVVEDADKDNELSSDDDDELSDTNSAAARNVDNDSIGTAEVNSDDSLNVKNKKVAKTSKSSSHADVDMEAIGTADDDSDDTNESPKKAAAKRPSSRRRSNNRKAVVDSSSEDESDDRHDNEPPPMSSSPPKFTNCPSKEDAITMDHLPAEHVCFYGPDGSTRHCFALETLRRIALTSEAPPQYDDEGRRTFLQPPHFRSKMSDDLLDQIASRFGRDALDIEKGAYYHRKVLDPSDIRTMREGFGEYDHVNLDHFQEQVNRYVVRDIMGNKDLYVCPLCYTVAFTRAVQETSPTASPIDATPMRWSKRKTSVEEVYSTDFTLDPMTVLASMDNFKLAAFCCFPKAAQVKLHLRNDHSVDTKSVRGNDLYERFKIRKPDGLLQRYMKREKGERALQGHLLQYWNRGCNFDLVYLLELVDEVNYCREIVESAGSDGDDDEKETEKARDHLDTPTIFYKGFEDDATALWQLISGPYQLNAADDLSDFVDDDNEAEDGGLDTLHAHRQLDREAAEQELEENLELEARVRERYEQGSDDDDDDEDRYEDESSVASDEVPVAESSEEEVEDDWVAARRPSLKGNRRFSSGPTKRLQPKSPVESDDSVLVLSGQSADESDKKPKARTTSLSGKAKKRIRPKSPMESDDSVLILSGQSADEADKKPKARLTSLSGKANKRRSIVLESSSDEG